MGDVDTARRSGGLHLVRLGRHVEEVRDALSRYFAIGMVAGDLVNTAARLQSAAPAKLDHRWSIVKVP